MTFNEATDSLLSRVDQKELAEELGISVASIRQARLKPEASAHRSPPPDWERAVIRLAEGRISTFRKLIEEIRNSSQSGRKHG